MSEYEALDTFVVFPFVWKSCLRASGPLGPLLYHLEKLFCIFKWHKYRQKIERLRFIIYAKKKSGVHYLNSFDQIFSSIFFWSGLFFGASYIVLSYFKYVYARNIYFFLIFSDYFIEDSYLVKFTIFWRKNSLTQPIYHCGGWKKWFNRLSSVQKPEKIENLGKNKKCFNYLSSLRSGTHRRAFLYGFKEKMTVKHTLVVGGNIKNW